MRYPKGQLRKIPWVYIEATGCMEVETNHRYPRGKLFGKEFLLHRFVLEKKLGRPISPGLFALHSCDNSRCINPDHLREGTAAENTADAMNRKGHLLGAKNPNARLTEVDVQRIRERLKTGERQVDIGRDFGVTQAMVSAIKRGANWQEARP